MIVLMMLGSIVIYVLVLLLSLWVVSRFIKSKKAKWVVFIIWLLIPTWDVILCYPIYWYLCKYEAGVKIYKTVDNVEGFYIGKQSKKFEPHEPYKGYRYVDYKEEESRKYYRSYWIENNTSEFCVPIGDDKWTHNGELYSKRLQQGKCIVKEEIAESEVSRWEYVEQSKKLQIFNVIDLRIDSTVSIKDTKNNQLVSEIIRIIWKGGWLYGLLASIPVGDSWKVQYPKIANIDFTQFRQQTLKPKGEK